MSVKDLYPSNSNFLKAKDLNGKQIKGVISGVETSQFDDGPKLVLSFQGTDKKFTLNKTNAEKVADQYGDDEMKWIGKVVVLYPDKTKYNGNMVDCIRVRVDSPVVEGFGPPAGHPAAEAPFSGGFG